MAGSSVPTFKSFVTEKEVEEVKKKRQEEWERVRKPSDPLERPEPELDNRTLYERLKEQRDRKQEEWSEQFKFKNMIYKGLDDDESGFLTLVAQRRAEHEADVIRSETSEVAAYREAVSRLHDEAESLPASSSKDMSEGGDKSKGDTKPSGVKKRSQLSLIAGSIKTKRKRTSSEVSDTKEPTGTGEEAQTSPEKKVKVAQESCDTIVKDTTPSQSSQLGALSGLAAYSSSESEDEQ